eukprot:scaffold27063_cov200-Skeletonema_menzelii.AAC.2
MTNSTFADEEKLPIDEQDEDEQPWRSEFNSLLDRMETLEQQYQQQQQHEGATKGVTFCDEVHSNNRLYDDPTSAAEEPETKNGTTNLRRHSLVRLLMPKPKQNNRAQRSHSAPETTLSRSSLQYNIQESVFGLEQVEARYDEFHLPESSYTFLITEPILSAPFAVGLIAYAVVSGIFHVFSHVYMRRIYFFVFSQLVHSYSLSSIQSIACLALALQNELDNGSDDNPYSIAEVTTTVRIVQYLGCIIGVIMDDEIPTGLELIGKALEQKTDGEKESNVLDIFFDMIALEFVETIDDVIFELCKRGFFSRRLKVVANQEYVIQCSSSRDARRVRKWSKRFIRAMYFSTAIILLSGLSIITERQFEGAFGCRSLIIDFGDGVWEDAWVMLDQKCSVDADCNNANHRCYSGDGFCYENRLLIYSHFNGYYNQEGNAGERPRYVERNKEKGDPFKSTIPAELWYCEDIESWVLSHPKIRPSLDADEINECNWLLRSGETEEFDLVELSTAEQWFLWKGQIQKDYHFQVSCAECANDAECNYFGKCKSEPDVDQKCDCIPGRFGVFCEHEIPCEVIRSEKDPNTTLKIVKDLDKDGDNINFVNIYGRPLYQAKMNGKPISVMRRGYPGQEEQYFEVKYPANASAEVAPHKHESPVEYFDDDFFEIYNKSTSFQQLMSNYTFLLRYTGRRWYGQILDPGLSGETFKEEEYHAFWMNSFSGLGQDDNSTLIISEPTSKNSP